MGKLRANQLDIESILHRESATCKSDVCALIKAVKKLGSEWRIITAYYLLEKPLRFNDLLRKGNPDDLNPRTLSRTLKHLEKIGVIERQVVGTQPFAVVYRLTEKGQDMRDILSAYHRWGEKWTTSTVHPLQTLSAKRIAG